MTFLKSKLGWAFCGIYTLITSGIWLYSLFCKALFCQLIIALPVFPFIAFFDEFFSVNFFTYLLSFLMSALVIYSLGAGIGRIYKK